MPSIEAGLLAVRGFDELSRGSTVLHRLDARIKMIVTCAFLVTVASYGPYEVSALIPLFLFPAVMLSLGRIPPGTILKRMALAAPFAVFMGLFNPLLDGHPVEIAGGFSLRSGWISYASILLRFTLAVSAVLLLLAVTGMDRLGRALQAIGVPAVFVTQFLFLYRYVFLLIDQAGQLIQGRRMRAFGRPLGITEFSHLAGSLLLRTLDRGQRIHTSMASRGFQHQMRSLDSARLSPADFGFLLVWIGFFVLCRSANLPTVIGRFALEVFA